MGICLLRRSELVSLMGGKWMLRGFWLRCGAGGATAQLTRDTARNVAIYMLRARSRQYWTVLVFWHIKDCIPNPSEGERLEKCVVASKSVQCFCLLELRCE